MLLSSIIIIGITLGYLILIALLRLSERKDMKVINCRNCPKQEICEHAHNVKSVSECPEIKEKEQEEREKENEKF